MSLVNFAIEHKGSFIFFISDPSVEQVFFFVGAAVFDFFEYLNGHLDNTSRSLVRNPTPKFRHSIDWVIGVMGRNQNVGI